MRDRRSFRRHSQLLLASLAAAALICPPTPTAVAQTMTSDAPVAENLLIDSRTAATWQDGETSVVQLNGPVTLQLDNGTPYNQNGKLQFSEVIVDPTTGAVTLRAIFPNPTGILLPGMFVRATIIEGVQNVAILVPQQGVSRNVKGDPTALVVDSKGFARLHALKVARAIGNKWLVTDGLKPGDKLIVEGLQKVQPDMPVQTAPASFLKTAR